MPAARPPAVLLPRLVLALGLAFTAALPAAVVTVNTDEDLDLDDGSCSLREAILATNADAAHRECPAGDGADTIEFALVPSTDITIQFALPVIVDDLTIAGPGVDQLAIDGDGDAPILVLDSPDGDRTLEVRDLTLRDGYGPLAAGAAGGVTVYDGDSAILRRVRLHDHVSDLFGGALLLVSFPPRRAQALVVDCLFDSNESGGGGAIYATAGSVLEVRRSTFTDNFASSDLHGGGAIGAVRTVLRVARSTISGNRSNGRGGGIRLLGDGVSPTSLELADSTVVGNVADADGSGGVEGGGIAVSGVPVLAGSDPIAVDLQNNVIAGNRVTDGSQPDDLVFGAPSLVTDHGFNLVGSNFRIEPMFPAGTPNANGSYVGTSASPLDPLLEPLADNGGPVPTHLPISASASWTIDRGDCFVLAADQRGFVDPTTNTRPVDDPLRTNGAGDHPCDIGAVESGAVEPPLDPMPFVDGFESGDTDAWSATVGG
jgi:CSLREA domain-containing protein